MRRPDTQQQPRPVFFLTAGLLLFALLDFQLTTSGLAGAALTLDDRPEFSAGAVDTAADPEDQEQLPGSRVTQLALINAVSRLAIPDCIATPSRLTSSQRARAPPLIIS